MLMHCDFAISDSYISRPAVTYVNVYRRLSVGMQYERRSIMELSPNCN